MNGKQIHISGGEVFLTADPKDAVRVISGNVFVYIVPWENKTVGRRYFLYQGVAGDVIPAYCYLDADYREWRFCFVALEEADLAIMQGAATSVLKRKFAQKADITGFKEDGFEESLADLYRTNMVRENSFIHKTRKSRADTREESLRMIYRTILPPKRSEQKNDFRDGLYDVLHFLCKKQHIPIADFEDIDNTVAGKVTVEEIARISHFSYRRVVLEDGWERKDAGPLLVFDEDNTPYACLRANSGKYYLYRPGEKKGRKLTGKNARQMQMDAFSIYRPFPDKKLEWMDVMKFAISGVLVSDITRLLFMSIFGAVIGMALPRLNQAIYDKYIMLGNFSVIVQIGCLIISFMLGNVFFGIVKNLSGYRLSSHVSYDVQSAAYDRIFRMPERLFRDYDSADLAGRVMGIGELANNLASIFIAMSVSLIFGIVYLFQMLSYSRLLSLLCFLMTAIYSAMTFYMTMVSMKYQEESISLNSRASSKMFQFLNGITKIRIAGAEEQAVHEYLIPYTRMRKLSIKMGTMDNRIGTFQSLAEALFLIVLYLMMGKGFTSISMGVFLAFNSAFGGFSGAVRQIVSGFCSLKQMQPQIEWVAPVFENVPEFSEGDILPGKLQGNIEISNLDFSYSEHAPKVLSDFNLSIAKDEYVGIVGSSGCGKSTLLKLLLGFEQPSQGKIYFDNMDLDSLNKQELRKNFGVVLQNGQLISGSIYENITITAPDASIDAVEEIVRKVGLEKDIKEMPMGLHTMVSENCETLSGGQQQRLLIARALINNPQVIFFDEATSALDNVTQAMVSETLDSIKATKIVIAHRLSTIKNCDRIIVLDKGKIAEEGNYNALMERKGLFYNLAVRQMT